MAMKFWAFSLISLVVIPVLWAGGDVAVGMGDISFFPREIPTYAAGVINGLCFGAFLWRSPVSRA